MPLLKLSKRNVLAILFGFLLIFGITIITSTISFFIVSNVMHTTQDLKTALSTQPILIITEGITFISPILGGLLAGWIVKEKGWLYGGILGIILILISVGISILPFLLPASLLYGANFPKDYGSSLAQKGILNQLLHSPVTIILTVIGGYLGEKFHKNWKQ